MPIQVKLRVATGAIGRLPQHMAAPSMQSPRALTDHARSERSAHRSQVSRPAALATDFRRPGVVQVMRETAFLRLLPAMISLMFTRKEANRVFGPDLPGDASYSATDHPDPALDGMTFKVTYDQGYCGHFSVPGADGAAADFNKVLAAEDPFAFIRERLTFAPADSTAVRFGEEELVVFSNGVCNLHAVKPGFENEWPSPFRVQRIADVLGCRMAQMHVSTGMDQGFALLRVFAPFRWSLKFLRWALGERGMFLPMFRGRTAVWPATQRDNVELLCSLIGFVKPKVKEYYVRLLEANERARAPLVFMPYSRGTVEVSGALREYISGYGGRHGLGGLEAQRRVKELLRETLTVVSFGNADTFWPDGPAYVHMSLRSDDVNRGTDPVTQSLGVTAAKPTGAGQDAVFLHCDGIFNGVHSHSILASGAPALKLVLAMNDIGSFRELWEVMAGAGAPRGSSGGSGGGSGGASAQSAGSGASGRSANGSGENGSGENGSGSAQSSSVSGEGGGGGGGGGFRIPSPKEVAAAVVLMQGVSWLEDEAEALEGVELPSEEEAEELVGHWLQGEHCAKRGDPCPSTSPPPRLMGKHA